MIEIRDGKRKCSVCKRWLPQSHWNKDAQWGEWKPFQDGPNKNWSSLGIEVKIGVIPTGSLIRQIKLYQSYTSDQYRFHIARWLAATHYDLSQSEIDQLRNEGIYHIRLGPKFDEWASLADVGKNVEV